MSAEASEPKIIFPKPTVDEVHADILDNAWVKSPALEEEIEVKFQHRKHLVENLRRIGQRGLTESSLIEFIRSDPQAINVIISLVGMSQEEFKRIITLKRILAGQFTGEWNTVVIHNEAKRNDTFARELAQLFLRGKEYEELAQRLPKFIQNKFDRKKLLLDADALVNSLIRTGLKGGYDATKGRKVEDEVESVLNELKVPFLSRIKVPGIGRNMDFVLPNLEDPLILIEVGVYQTSARELTEKGIVEGDIRRQVKAQYPKAVLVRITDGIGWIARGKNDLAKVIDASHYTLTLKRIGRLRDIVKAHVPQRYFRKTITEF